MEINSEVVRSDFDAYTIDGFLCQEKGFLDGNVLLATSEKMIIYQKLGILTEQDKSEYMALVRSCELTPGLYRRRPGDDTLESHDGKLSLRPAACSRNFRVRR